jgi:hypothetical protein
MKKQRSIPRIEVKGLKEEVIEQGDNVQNNCK